MSVYEGTGDGGVVFCDLPKIPTGSVGKFIVQQMAAVAELERGLISERTRAALAAAKARGTKLGGWRGGPVVDAKRGGEGTRKAADAFASSVAPMVLEMRQTGHSLARVAKALTERGIRTARGGNWTATTVKNVLERAGA